jgi:hypothetical protein
MESCRVLWSLKRLHRGISRRPPPPHAEEEFLEGANACGAGDKPEPQGAAPGSAQRDCLRKTPLEEPEWSEFIPL